MAMQRFLLLSVLPAASLALSSCKSDVFFLLDSSGSDRRHFETQRNYIRNIAEALDDSHQIGVMVFSGRYYNRVFVPLSKPYRIAEEIDRLPHIRGVTLTGTALNKAYSVVSKGKRPGVPLFVITVTDGFSWDDTAGPSKKLRSLNDVTTLAAGVVSHLEREELEHIAGSPKNLYFGSYSWRDIVSRLNQDCGFRRQNYAPKLLIPSQPERKLQTPKISFRFPWKPFYTERPRKRFTTEPPRLIARCRITATLPAHFDYGR